ncbi:MAG: hypothetical protein KC656_14335, partial [Myxococcales bacterium]|nr:hypothetical protein [Myxococcales bacterium]
QEVQDFARGLAPEVPWVDARAEVYVNLDNTCNAWFDGTLNFLRESDACRNTGRQADVIFHEWGHGFHDASLLAGAYDFSLGEGAADTLAMLKNRDSRIAPGFFFQGTDALRDTLNTRRYPDDYTPDQTYIHQNGLILGGSMWDVKEALQRTMGEDEAYATLARIFVRMLKGGPTLETAYAEALLADDVDGDLSNGTPNQCALVEGFGLHGLGPQGGQDVAPLHAVPESLTAEVLPLRVELPDPAPTCLELVAHSATLHWRVDDGPWQQIPMVLDGQEVRASLPVDDLAPGTLVSYWSELETSLGHTVSDPTGGPIRPHTLHVGGLLPIWCQDFEADDGDFRHSLVGGEDVDGADDWAWGTPIGLSGDPAGAASGSKAWGNDLGGGRFDGAYQNEKHNRLASPKLPTFHYDGVLLRYQRWLTVEDGFYDHATILADGVEVWSNHASGADVGDEHHLDDRWEPHTVPLRGQADDGEVKLAWELRTDQGFQAGGWTLDDVCLHAPDTPDNRLGMNDFTARRDADSTTVRLSWTMPHHDPVDEVVVVRKRGAWPTGPTDGDQVFRTTRITLEAPATAVDEEASGVDLYYAAYARDGRTWLSWTREGFNAASVDPRPPGEDPEGCGCATGSSSRSGLLALMLGLPLWHRRRRRPPARSAIGLTGSPP